MEDHELRSRLSKSQVQAASIREHRDACRSEEQTKISLINPYLECLGIEVRNPLEVTFEYDADIGKKGEKIDYCILDDEGEPIIAIEAKIQSMQIKRNDEPPAQLFRYSHALESVHFFAYTNGVDWNWYARESNGRLEKLPFLVHSAAAPTEREIEWLYSLSSLKSDPDRLNEIAIGERYYTRLLNWLFEELTVGPTNELVDVIGRKIKQGSNTTKNDKEAIKKLWNSVVFSADVKTYIDNQFASRTGQISSPSDSEYLSDPQMSIDKKNVAENLQSTTCEFQTETGQVVLHSGSNRRAWRCRGREHWSICKSMKEVCLEIIREIASMDDRGKTEFLRTVSRKTHFIDEVSSNIQSPSYWSNLDDQWLFKTNAGNDLKLKWVKEISDECVRGQKHIDFESEFEIWNPTNTK